MDTTTPTIDIRGDVPESTVALVMSLTEAKQLVSGVKRSDLVLINLSCESPTAVSKITKLEKALSEISDKELPDQVIMLHITLKEVLSLSKAIYRLRLDSLIAKISDLYIDSITS